MLVRDVMTPHPVAISPETPVSEALKLLLERGFRRLPVLEGGRLVGIVTQKDLVDAQPSRANTLSVWELQSLLSKMPVRQMMSSPVYTVLERDHLEDAALLLQKRKIGGLSVVNDAGQLTGMLTVTDVLGAFIQTLGYAEGGERLTLEMPDVPGSLARAAQAVLPSNLVSVATAGVEGGQRRFVLRVGGEALGGVRERLTAADIRVVEE